MQPDVSTGPAPDHDDHCDLCGRDERREVMHCDDDTGHYECRCCKPRTWFVATKREKTRGN